MPPTVPLPRRMRGLQKDSRGYPIPFNVLRDTDNKPHFAINDDRKRARILKENRCPICGSKLDRLLWFCGGPLSAFHEDGWYNDTAMHHECMTYALQVCPYLSMPNYLGRVDAGTLDPAKLPNGCPGIFLDHTQIAERPPVFVAVASTSQEISPRTGYVRPIRPYSDVEYWKDGKQITVQLAVAIIEGKI